MANVIYFTFFLELWFVVEWEGEDGNYTPVPQKSLVGATDPLEGDLVSVKESGTKRLFRGVVLKKGTFSHGCRYRCQGEMGTP